MTICNTSVFLNRYKMDDFTINPEDLIGLSGKVVVITGDSRALFPTSLSFRALTRNIIRGLVWYRSFNDISAAGARGISRRW